MPTIDIHPHIIASDEAKYVTGTEILVDGGLMARSA